MDKCDLKSLAKVLAEDEQQGFINEKEFILCNEWNQAVEQSTPETILIARESEQEYEPATYEESVSVEEPVQKCNPDGFNKVFERIYNELVQQAEQHPASTFTEYHQAEEREVTVGLRA